ncbi:MAG: hypothetical protein KKA62_06065 [Nanoarchaeota archaeon]|nr:hypothetical protein [Nanoarchaeota archaeon]MBU1644075.1 hypothetical protein [Nanoarchaeota archaeon]MBU1977490.1 hypothetical protein [Nanoarchaeota archaeon]
MFRLFFTPGWFNGYDLLFDGIVLVIALLIAAYSWRIYRIHKTNRFAYFSLAFIMVALSLAFKMFTNSVLYSFPVRETMALVLSPAVGEGLRYSDLFYRAGFFLQMAFMLGAWLLIFLISQKSRNRLNTFHELTQIGLFVYLVLLISVISNFKFVVFYLTSAVLLGLIVLNYYKNCLNVGKKKNASRVLVAFLFLLFGYLSWVFVFLYGSLYAIGELFMLIGFLLLLYTYRKIVKK